MKNLVIKATENENERNKMIRSIWWEEMISVRDEYPVFSCWEDLRLSTKASGYPKSTLQIIEILESCGEDGLYNSIMQGVIELPSPSERFFAGLALLKFRENRP